MCVCVHVCVSVCACVCVCVYIHVHVCVRMHVKCLHVHQYIVNCVLHEYKSSLQHQLQIVLHKNAGALHNNIFLLTIAQ